MMSETKNCKQCGEQFIIEDDDLLFYKKISPTFDGKVYEIPSPTFCPECRMQRRMSFRNEHVLYKRKCDKTNENIISMYNPDVPFPVWHLKVWWSDENDATVFGKEIDFNQNIFYQMKDLQKLVPRAHIFTYALDRLENSIYTNCSGDLKDCYLIFSASRDENCYYSHYIMDSYKCMDILYGVKSSFCYQCIDIFSCNNVLFSQNCRNCTDSLYLFDCRGCDKCLGCVGLRNKKYFILNKQVNKEEFDKNFAKLKKDKNFRDDFNKKYFDLLASKPRRYMIGEHNENCTGNSVSNSKNCGYCFDTTDAEDSKYCTWFDKGKDCMDFYAWGEAEWCYEVVSGGDHMYKCAFTASSYGDRDCYYLDNCYYCQNCFACVGLKKKQYCILNKQYSKEEYEKLVPKLIEKMKATPLRPSFAKASDAAQQGFEGQVEWGEFFDLDMSPFNYNETIANDYYPLTEEKVSSIGGKWLNKDYTPKFVGEIYKPKKDIEGYLNDESERQKILNGTIECEVTGKRYKILPQELAFYIENEIPIPTKHYEVRLKERLALRYPRKLYHRQCMCEEIGHDHNGKCKNEFKTTYAPERSEKVYCESCYQKSIIQ